MGLITGIICGVAAGAGAVALTPVLIGAAGFTAAGIAAGSIAAGIQSAVYGAAVTSGSTFALLQSAGATGVLAASTMGAVGTTVGGTVAAAAIII